MARFKVGIHLRPQHTDVPTIRAAWKAADALGVDVITTWDHFHPLTGDPAGAHFECWSLLAAMACETKNARIGPMVASITYRNPDLVADMARTIDHLSGGRFNLGLGAGNSQRDHDDFGYDFGTAGSRLRQLEAALPRIKERLKKLNPPPIGSMPIVIGGRGEKFTLRLVAQYADIWNGGGPPDAFGPANGVLNDWCAKVGRNPADILRSTNIPANAVERAEEWVGVGAGLLLMQADHPFDLKPLEQLLKIAGK